MENSHNQVERMLSLKEACKVSWFPRRVHYATMWRWATKGVNGRRLRTVRFGDTMATTEGWLREFMEAGADAVAPVQAPSSRTSRSRSHMQAVGALAAAGITAA